MGALIVGLASAPAVPPAHAVAPSGDLDVLVVLAQFPDLPMTRERTDFTGGPGALVDRFVAYWAEVSSGRLRLRAHVATPLVTVPEARARYVQRPDALARDALRGLAAVADDAADRAALARGGALVVFFAGVGRESHAGEPGRDDPWSNYTALGPPELGFSETIVVAEREQARSRRGEIEPLSSFGVLCHEFGHLLGLPELYAPGGRAHEGIGIWGLMGQGTWVGRGDRPPHPDAWSKARLGWVDVIAITETTRGVALPPIEREPRAVRIPVAADRPHEYYLLEYRRRIGADERLPGEGLLVWHVDERRLSFRLAQADPRRKLLHLVEADGRGDLDRGVSAGGNRGDGGDPWVGPTFARRALPAVLVVWGGLALAAAVFRLARAPGFRAVGVRLAFGAALIAAGAALRPRAPVCGPWHPGMAPYDGTPGRVVISNIGPLRDEMRFDVHVRPAASPP